MKIKTFCLATINHSLLFRFLSQLSYHREFCCPCLMNKLKRCSISVIGIVDISHALFSTRWLSLKTSVKNELKYEHGRFSARSIMIKKSKRFCLPSIDAAIHLHNEKRLIMVHYNRVSLMQFVHNSQTHTHIKVNINCTSGRRWCDRLLNYFHI